MSSIAECRRLLTLSVAMAVVVLSSSATAHLTPPTGPSYGGSVPNSRKVVSGIAWYGVLTEGLAEAKRTGKPVLFITAAPQCRGVSGMW